MSQSRYYFLDAIRGIAALLVCISHLRVVAFVDYPQLSFPTILEKAFYFITGLGHQSVVVFFVLSGFFVGGSILRNMQQFSWESYIIARLSRLWVVLAPALIVSYFVAKVLFWLAPESLAGVYLNIWHSGPSRGSYSDSFTTLIGNLLFLQTIFTPVYGANGPLWSLANEFWYYMLFPLLLVLVGGVPKYKNLAIRAVFFILVAIIFIYMPFEMQYGFICWCMGVASYFVLVNGFKTNAVWICFTTIAFVFSLLLVKFKFVELGGFADILLALNFAALIIGVANLSPPKVFSIIFIKLSRGLSEISYSLYLSHFPIVMLIGGLIYKADRTKPGLTAYLHLTAWLFLLLGVGIVFWLLFERHTNSIRKNLLQYFKIKQ